jgi:hypothetical protein
MSFGLWILGDKSSEKVNKWFDIIGEDNLRCLASLIRSCSLCMSWCPRVGRDQASKVYWCRDSILIGLVASVWFGIYESLFWEYGYVAVVADDFIVCLLVAARVVRAAIIYVPLAVCQGTSLFLLTRHPINSMSHTKAACPHIVFLFPKVSRSATLKSILSYLLNLVTAT